MITTEFFLIAAQNNAIKTNSVKETIDKTQQNSKCRLHPIITECSKLKQKAYETRHEEADPLGIVQEIEIWPYEQVVYAQQRIYPGECNTQRSLGI